MDFFIEHCINFLQITECYIIGMKYPNINCPLIKRHNTNSNLVMQQAWTSRAFMQYQLAEIPMMEVTCQGAL